MENKAPYKVKRIDILKGAHEVLLNKEDAEELGLRTQDRVKVVHGKGESQSAVVNITDTLVSKGEAGAFIELWRDLKEGEKVHIVPTSRPASIDFVRKKIYGNAWSQEEINTIVEDIALGKLSDIELAAYTTAVQINGMSMDEITWLTTAMVRTGETLEWESSPILDVHSIGGVPGNKYAPITVSIVAANGLTIPKTSSRAISSAAGTADIMEVVCNVEHGGQSIKRIAQKVGGALVWGGGMNLAPVDDAIIRVEYPLSLDPHGQVLASVMAKKKAVGAEYCVIDIPMGEGAKITTSEEAKSLARDFIILGERIGVKTRCAITYGGQPVGRAVGPALEIREVLSVLEGAKEPNSLIEKALSLAGILLELGGMARPDRGLELAKKTLESGKALKKFKEIIEAQGGDPDIKAEDIMPGKYTYELPSPKDGYIEAINNRAIVKIARSAGSPKDKGAGIVLGFKKGEGAEKGEALLTIYAENKRKLDDAKTLASKLQPIRVEGMILGEVVG
ncbi:MAG: AMP phosphorylase [Methanocellales archaeon]|nr:AMP phosphorylase [Methanocellales archaeon]MDD3292036.1 AMP phosphorylase [Methanocellales archaeon]MDD5235681.1 AMP phosphorylase [Methanocellales archaeon]MDD5485607.1 AMP phosphorylase [Methanocellales archaeon]